MRQGAEGLLLVLWSCEETIVFAVPLTGFWFRWAACLKWDSHIRAMLIQALASCGLADTMVSFQDNSKPSVSCWVISNWREVNLAEKANHFLIVGLDRFFTFEVSPLSFNERRYC